MLHIHLLLVFVVFELNWIESTTAFHVTEKFLATGTYEHLVICNLFSDDLETLEQIELSQKYEIFIKNWDCQMAMNIGKTLIFLNEPRLDVLVTLFSQPGAQRRLASNTWLIRTKNSSIELNEYFKNNTLKLGLNAKLFFLVNVNSNIVLHQALGTGELMPKFQVIKYRIDCSRYTNLSTLGILSFYLLTPLFRILEI